MAGLPSGPVWRDCITYCEPPFGSCEFPIRGSGSRSYSSFYRYQDVRPLQPEKQLDVRSLQQCELSIRFSIHPSRSHRLTNFLPSGVRSQLVLYREQRAHFDNIIFCIACIFCCQDSNAARLFSDEAAAVYERATSGPLKKSTLLHFAHADYEESRLHYNKVYLVTVYIYLYSAVIDCVFADKFTN